MKMEDSNNPLQSSLIDELRVIREALNKIPTEQSNQEIPLLDEIIQSQPEDEDFCEIPVLADPILMPDEETHQQAIQSWEIVEKMLYQWGTTMDNPVSLLSTELFQVLSSQLSTNWEALFSKQTPEQLQQWKQWLLENNSNQIK